MNNFRKHTPNSRKSKAVDGFIRLDRGSSLSGRPASVGANSQPESGSVFRSTEGFHTRKRQTAPGMRQSQLSARAPARDELGNIKLNMPDDLGKRKNKQQKRNILRIAGKSFVALIISTVLVGGYLIGKGVIEAGRVLEGGGGAAALRENVDPTQLNGEGDGRVNIMLLGRGGEGHEGADLTDTIVIASLDPIQKEASLLSIPRDLWVRSNGANSKINAVFANAKSAFQGDSQEEADKAGIDALDSVIEGAMGIPIHYYMMIDFNGFEKAINTVGGIDIDVTKPLYEVQRVDGQRYVLDVRPGRETFDGKRALAYSRSRLVSPRGDFDRAERQRSVLLALKDKILSVETFSNPVRLSQLISDFGGSLRSNLGTGEVLRLYEIGKDINSSTISSIGLADPPNNFVTTGNIAGQSVVIPTAGVDNFSEIRGFVRNSLRDGFLKNEDANIAVYNGTNIPGLAGTGATDLRSFGYNITAVADAPTKNYQNTILVDLTNGSKRFTQSYLERRLNTTAVRTIPDATILPAGADFVIIFGQDANFTQ